MKVVFVFIEASVSTRRLPFLQLFFPLSFCTSEKKSLLVFQLGNTCSKKVHRACVNLCNSRTCAFVSWPVWVIQCLLGESFCWRRSQASSSSSSTTSSCEPSSTRTKLARPTPLENCASGKDSVRKNLWKGTESNMRGNFKLYLPQCIKLVKRKEEDKQKGLPQHLFFLSSCSEQERHFEDRWSPTYIFYLFLFNGLRFSLQTKKGFQRSIC